MLHCSNNCKSERTCKLLFDLIKLQLFGKHWQRQRWENFEHFRTINTFLGSELRFLSSVLFPLLKLNFNSDYQFYICKVNQYIVILDAISKVFNFKKTNLPYHTLTYVFNPICCLQIRIHVVLRCLILVYGLKLTVRTFCEHAIKPWKVFYSERYSVHWFVLQHSLG